MSDVIVPSFFPTSTEIAGGIQWVKQHPVVATAAAAAATAVSVFTYFKACAEDDSELASTVLSPCRKPNDSTDRCSSTESDASTPLRDRNLSLRDLSSMELHTIVSVESEEVTERNRELEAALQDVDGETASPQWGWYVSTTPPEDYYS